MAAIFVIAAFTLTAGATAFAKGKNPVVRIITKGATPSTVGCGGTYETPAFSSSGKVSCKTDIDRFKRDLEKQLAALKRAKAGGND